MSQALPATSHKVLTFAVIGNPNTGKSTLFSLLTGLRTRTGNYPGVTVEKKIGRMKFRGEIIQLVDLPGTYSLSPRSRDEMVSVDVLLGRQPDVGGIDGVLCIVDASNLERNLYLLSQLLDLGLPIVLILNMWDVAQRRQITVDVPQLSKRLGIPVICCQAHRGWQVDQIREALLNVAKLPAPVRPQLFAAEFERAVTELASEIESGRPAAEKKPYGHGPAYLAERLILDQGGAIEEEMVAKRGTSFREHLEQIRAGLKAQGVRIPGVEAKARYRWIRDSLHEIHHRPIHRIETKSDKMDRWLTHWATGGLVFVGVMLAIFWMIFTGSEPATQLIEIGQQKISQQIEARINPGPFCSLLVDGLLAGVGGVIVFLPQIMLLFFFMALLEDCGYMARAAFLTDRAMRQLGLSGKSFLPFLSSFGCAIPGIMATRVIENTRDRMVTMLVAPLMSCSARLPVYSLMIAAFIPDDPQILGMSLKVWVLAGMVSIGAVIAAPIAWILKKTFFRGETPPFVLELPSYKWPSFRLAIHRMLEQAWSFLSRAGSLIVATSILVWAAAYFPEDHTRLTQLRAEFAAVSSQNRNDEAATSLARSVNLESARLLEQSYLGQFGRFLEPAVKPLGWDWRLGVGALASFPAREVIVATLGTVFSLGADVTESDGNLAQALTSATDSAGKPLYNAATGLSMMVFFALCAQCSSTLLVMRRETNSWRWPVFTFIYMSTLAYVGAFFTYQVASRWLA